MPDRITKAGRAVTPRGVGKACREIGYCAVYIIGFDDAPEPVKIGIAADVGARFDALQVGNWRKMKLHAVIWTAGRPLALRVEQKTHDLLERAGKRVAGEWFSVPPEWAAKAIATAAASLDIRTFSDAEMRKRAGHRVARNEARDWAAFPR
ncbi:GIY-YIG nuclease family protein [Methylopila sp. Yamaguchi]|uniref:GIY-YIG nuclease family protein n=1 Tax=Methylopila sp. Yamaguchi TaxID=1437817 RepID=UPI000CCA34C4|nr:GIY-YIG nuclease family protein [Methylopila sp. Yamaguchi]GBD48082.1 hypothetical protein METY_1295 [Methylopila sp. Yamaguchi]